jgi:hypothetical protein
MGCDFFVVEAVLLARHETLNGYVAYVNVLDNAAIVNGCAASLACDNHFRLGSPI